MSQPTKRTTRVIQPKKVTAVNATTTTPVIAPVTTPVVAPVVTPVVAPVVPVAAATDVPVENGNTKRRQVGETIGVHISAARVRRHIDKRNLNKTIDALIAENREKIADLKTAKTCLETGKWTELTQHVVDGKKQFIENTRDITATERDFFTKTVADLSPLLPTFEMRIAALSRERTRFSNESSIALSIICDVLIQQLITHTIGRALNAKKKILQICHLHESGIEKLSLYPLISSLPSFVAMTDKLAAANTAAAAAAKLTAALTQAERDFKKKYAVHLSKKKKPAVEPTTTVASATAPVEAPSDVNVQVEADEAVDVVDTGESKTSFKFYVTKVCKDVQLKNPLHKSIRISTEIKSYLSDLLVELIRRIASLVHLTATCMKNKTISDVAIMRTVEALLIDGHQLDEVVTFTESKTNDPTFVKEENKKRDQAKLTGAEYKVDLSFAPQVPCMVAHRRITYPSCGFAELKSRVDEKLELYEKLSKDDKVIDDKVIDTSLDDLIAA